MSEGTQRKLAAIVSADVVGYSRLMGRDEAGTLAALRAHRAELLDPLIAKHGGRIVKTMGDGLLLEFPSVVDATRCVIEIQRGMAERNEDVDEDRCLIFRIGVNLGDIVIEGDDILGDGVNIAARLQQIAEPGGLSISGRVYEDVRDRLDVDFNNIGEQSLKNIARPVPAWHWTPAEFPAARKTASNAPLQLPDRPSIVILPFDNMSGDPEQEYFSDGITEDITTALSRISDLFVIARNSAFSYKNRSIDVRQVGTELGVRYILEGSVRKAGSRMRITGQLIDAEMGTHLWADKFDSAIEDVFELQDLVTAAVAGAIGPSVTQAEIKRASLKPTDNLKAYDFFLKALGVSELYTRDGIERAIQFARQATKMDPQYAQAYAYIARWLQMRRIYGWTDNEAEEIDEGIRLSYLAVQLQPNDPTVLSQAAFALAHLNVDLETAIPWFDRALALNPNSAMAYGRGAVVRNFAGEYETAADHADHAMRLSPFDTFIFAFSMARGVSHLMRRELAEAITWLRKAAQENPRHSPTFLALASALAHSDQLEGAAAAIQRFMEMQPMSSAAWERKRRRYREADFDYLLDGARKAGFRE
jgi:TolB-like protein/class 3 adenylate cyclase/tetratricopeptide (TPR) repeat protein